VKGKKELAYLLLDADGNLKAIDDQVLTGNGPSNSNPSQLGLTHAYTNLEPWRGLRVIAVLLVIMGWAWMDGNYSLALADASGGSFADSHTASVYGASVAKTVGRKLRDALGQAYKQPRVTSGENPNQLDVSALVQEYLPVGTPIDQAVAILQSAGFQIRRESRGDHTSEPQPQLVVAWIEPYERHLLWTYYSSIRVQLTPVQEAGVEVISAVLARFSYPML
jgi:hypothetical protein